MRLQDAPVNGDKKSGASATTRDVAAMVFRQWRVLILSFIGLFLGGLFFLLRGDRYVARMMILVESSERSNPAVTAQPNAMPDTHFEVTEEEMNSELALLESRDLLEQVAVTCGLDSKPDFSLSRLWSPAHSAKEEALAKAVRNLANKLDIQVVKRSNVISIKYPSSDPQLAARVLQTLGQLYLKKHAAVHRPHGTVDFFEQQTDQYRNALSQAEAQLVHFTRDQGVVSAPLQTDAALRKLDAFETMEGETKAAIAQTQERIHTLEIQASRLSSRMTTQVKVSDNAQLLEQLKATLLTLELKRTELLGKFEPTYRPVKEVETQIAQTKAAIADAERSQWREETTDRDPAFELVREELTKGRAELAGLQAREAALDQTVRAYGSKAQWLQQQGVRQQDLIRTAKAEEDNYLLYLRKQQEARISDALDTHNILNVTLAEAATVPALPVHSGPWYLLVSGLIAGVGSLGLAFASDHLDPTLRTPDEVESLLDIPVLLSVPKKPNGKPNGKANGKGNGNGGIVTHVL